MRSPLTPPAFHSWMMSDGYVVRGRVWNARAGRACLYFHGIQSHGGWFEWSGSLLAQCGMAVVMPDRRGSGLNHDARGDCASVQRWMDDVDEVAAWVEREFAVSRIDLVGVSWGGKTAAMHALRHPQRIARLLLITPGIFPAVGVALSERMRIAASLFAGGQAQCAIPLSDPALFTDNPEGQRFITDDPLKLTHATARFLWHSTRFDRMLRRTLERSLCVPTTLWLAEHEQIIRNEPMRSWCERVCAEWPQLWEFTGHHHTLEFAADTGAFEAALHAWALRP